MKKEKFTLTCSDNLMGLNELVNYIGCYEDVESLFEIEFAVGVEKVGDQFKIIFPNDYLNTENEENFLEKYDGKVLVKYIRNAVTKEIYNLSEQTCSKCHVFPF